MRCVLPHKSVQLRLRRRSHLSRCTWRKDQEFSPAHVAERAHVIASAYRRILNEHDREDLAQDALVALLSRCQQGVLIRNPPAWLAQVMRNLAAMKRRAARHHPVALPTSDAEGDERAASWSFSCRPDPWATLEELLAAVNPGYTEQQKDLLRRLASGDRRRQIAAELGRSDDWVRAEVRKLLDRLRFFVAWNNST